jgi:L-fuconolactonase
LWNVETSDLYWLTPELREAGGPLVRDYSIQDLRAAFATVGVDRSILVQAWHDPDENERWLAIADANELIAGVVSYIDLEGTDVARLLDRFSAHAKFRGIRACGQDVADDDWLGRADVRAAIKELASRGEHSLDLLLNVPQLKDVPRLADENPELPMVLNHLAKPQTSEDGYFEPWAELMRPLETIPNLKFKISGMLAEAGPNPTSETLRPAVQFMIDTYGFDRLMWGNDWPVCLTAGSYKTNFDVTMGAVGDMTDSERASLLGGNARRFYRIE